MDSNRYYRI